MYHDELDIHEFFWGAREGCDLNKMKLHGASLDRVMCVEESALLWNNSSGTYKEYETASQGQQTY